MLDIRKHFSLGLVQLELITGEVGGSLPLEGFKTQLDSHQCPDLALAITILERSLTRSPWNPFKHTQLWEASPSSGGFPTGAKRPDVALNAVLGMLQDLRNHPCHLQLLHGAQARSPHAAQAGPSHTVQASHPMLLEQYDTSLLEQDHPTLLEQDHSCYSSSTIPCCSSRTTPICLSRTTLMLLKQNHPMLLEQEHPMLLKQDLSRLLEQNLPMLLKQDHPT